MAELALRTPRHAYLNPGNHFRISVFVRSTAPVSHPYRAARSNALCRVLAANGRSETINAPAQTLSAPVAMIRSANPRGSTIGSIGAIETVVGIPAALTAVRA